MAEQRKYRQTDTGRKAWESGNSGLPPAYRRILGVVNGVAYSDEILGAMHDCCPKQVQAWLDELETLCFIEALPFAGGRSASDLPRAA
jgi:hypothetical protein